MPISNNDRQSALTTLAQSLLALLGPEAAMSACQENGWIGVRDEILRLRAPGPS